MKTYMLGNKMRLTEYNDPKTINEAIEVLNDYFQYITPDEKIFFNESTTHSIVYQYHHGLGQKIRNAWLWPRGENYDQHSDLAKIFINLNMKHPDDMSHFLLELFWYFKHEPDILLEKHQERMLNEIIIKDIIE